MPTSNSHYIDTYITTLISVLNTKPDDKVYEAILDVLMEMFISYDTNIPTMVHSLKTLQKAMFGHKRHIINWSARAMTGGKHNPKQVLNYLLLFYSSDRSTTVVNQSEFIQHNLHLLLPPIIVNAVHPEVESTGAADSTLEMIAEYASCLGNKKIRTLLMHYFPGIFSHLIIHAKDQSHLKKCIAYLENKLGKDISELIPSNRNKVLIELLTMYNYSKSRITQALGMCAKSDNTFHHKEKRKDSKPLPQHVVATYVSKSLMGVLSSFMVSFSHRETSTEVKLQIIKSLNDIIIFLQHENLVTSKNLLMDCLRMTTIVSRKHYGFEEDALNLWNSFVSTMDSSSLIGILPQILCCMLPYINTSPKQTIKIFKFILKKCIDENG